jgi:hypothetical protein
MTLQTLAAALVKANNDRLDFKLSRDAHATIIREIDAWLTDAGYTWDDMNAACQQVTA